METDRRHYCTPFLENSPPLQTTQRIVETARTSTRAPAALSAAIVFFCGLLNRRAGFFGSMQTTSLALTQTISGTPGRMPIAFRIFAWIFDRRPPLSGWKQYEPGADRACVREHGALQILLWSTAFHTQNGSSLRTSGLKNSTSKQIELNFRTT
jgi:hypothetical protein